MTATIAQRHADRLAECETYIEKLSLGKAIDLDAAEQAAVAVGTTLAGLQAKADARRAKRQQREKLQTILAPERFDKAKSEKQAAYAEWEAAKAAHEESGKRLRTAHERYSAMVSAVSRIEQERTEANRELRKLDGWKPTRRDGAPNGTPVNVGMK